jgi:serine/threonine protein kinase
MESSPPLSTETDTAPPVAEADPGWSPARPTELAAGAIFAGRYRILRRLGRGGQGAVFLAHDLQVDRDVALKLPDPDSSAPVLDRLLREARAAAQLHHPNICPVYDVGRVDGVPYLTMMYVEGEPLSPWVNGGLIPQDRAAEIVRSLALTLQEAHAKGILHRDLKPSNIMVRP